MRGILKYLAEKTGKSVSEIKREIMLAITHPYRKIKKDLGITRGTSAVYFTYLRKAAPLVWNIVRTEKRVPTPDEVMKLLQAKYPNLEAELKKIYEESKAAREMAAAAATAMAPA